LFRDLLTSRFEIGRETLEESISDVSVPVIDSSTRKKSEKMIMEKCDLWDKRLNLILDLLAKKLIA